MLTEDTPLSRFAAVDTRSPDDAREAVGRIFCPHFLNPVGREAAMFHARHHTVEQAGYSMNFVAYGSKVEIDPGELSRFFLLQVPIRGAATVRCGTMATDVEAGRRASILSPTLGTRMTWEEGCEKRRWRPSSKALPRSARGRSSSSQASTLKVRPARRSCSMCG